MLKSIKKQLHQWIYNSAKPKFSETVVGYAFSKKWQIEKIQHAYSQELKLPNLEDVSATIREAYLAAQKIHSPDKYLICIPNGTCFSGFSRLPNGRYLPEGGNRMQAFLSSDVSRSRFQRNRLTLDGDCYYLNDLYSSNYAHWFRDALPRLAIALPFLPPATRFIIGESPASFKVDSLLALGVYKDRLIPVRDNYLLTRCERLWYVTQSKDDIWNPQAISRIRDSIIAHFGKAVLYPTPDRIFISRKDTAFKRLENEDQLVPVLEKYGYKIVILETLTLKQQVGLFSQVKSVIGAHGAGLTNILFSESSELLELEDEQNAPMLWYWIWSAMLGRKYSSMIGKVKGDISKSYDIRFKIDPYSLEQFLSSQFSDPKKRYSLNI